MGNNAIRGTSSPTGTDANNADAVKLWSWYHEVTGSPKTQATAFLTTVETEQLVHEAMLSDFRANLLLALPQTGTVEADAKNYAAIVGAAAPTTTGILAAAVNAYNQIQSMSATQAAKAKTMAETRVYESWYKRFKALIAANTFSGTDGFKHITKCMKETEQTTNPGDDSQGGTSGWAVYARVSAATKQKIRDLIVAQMSANTAAV